MDATKLVVGQEVYMFCGAPMYGRAKGEVVKITSAGVEVKSGERWGQGLMEIGSDRRINIVASVVDIERWGQGPRRVGEIGIVRFDNNGIELEADRRKRHGFEPGPGFSQDRFMQSVWYGAPECGPWTLDDIPFAERAALLEQRNGRSETSSRSGLNVRKSLINNVLNFFRSPFRGSSGEPFELVDKIRPHGGTAMLKTETDTSEMEARIREAFRVSKNGNHLGMHLCDIACERDYWCVTCPRCGREWEVVDANGGDSVDGFDFILRRYRLEFCRE